MYNFKYSRIFCETCVGTDLKACVNVGFKPHYFFMAYFLVWSTEGCGSLACGSLPISQTIPLRGGGGGWGGGGGGGRGGGGGEGVMLITRTWLVLVLYVVLWSLLKKRYGKEKLSFFFLKKHPKTDYCIDLRTGRGTRFVLIFVALWSLLNKRYGKEKLLPSSFFTFFKTITALT